jgi:PBP1b-binding outer membrane lipoprotein LpoB
MRACLKKSAAIEACALAAMLVVGCGPDETDPLQSSRDAWKSQQAEQQQSVSEAQQQASELMRDLGVGRP